MNFIVCYYQIIQKISRLKTVFIHNKLQTRRKKILIRLIILLKRRFSKFLRRLISGVLFIIFSALKIFVLPLLNIKPIFRKNFLSLQTEQL